MSEDKKQKMREAAKRYYHNNKTASKQRNKTWRQENKAYVIETQRLNKRKRKQEAIEYLGGKCQKCKNIFHPSIYEFHHLNPDEKDRDPSKMLQLSKVKLFAELDKCILLCANCHRFIHHGDKY